MTNLDEVVAKQSTLNLKQETLKKGGFDEEEVHLGAKWTLPDNLRPESVLGGLIPALERRLSFLRDVFGAVRVCPVVYAAHVYLRKYSSIYHRLKYRLKYFITLDKWLFKLLYIFPLY